MLKIIDAFSYASEYCEVGLCVKASNLQRECQFKGQGGRILAAHTM